MTTTSNGALSVKQCLALLRTVSVGRIIYTDNALPAVRVVTFAVANGEIVIPTEGDRWFDRVDGWFLAFQTDEIDPVTRHGWAAVAMGRGCLVPGAGGGTERVSTAGRRRPRARTRSS
ncbi:pyridoxamine 5'-phosphate oxidase family protein [Rhodococcus koreensis]|uniref:pyridoxamine 5'-phosphate oxidase family protein n=1 Tax=Rhodococcus koreensis TaxID=99653 RepID=UPI0036724A66